MSLHQKPDQPSQESGAYCPRRGEAGAGPRLGSDPVGAPDVDGLLDSKRPVIVRSIQDNKVILGSDVVPRSSIDVGGVTVSSRQHPPDS